MRALGGAIAAVLGLVAPCTAPAQWEAPQTVGGPSTFVGDPGLVFSGDGRALATWSWQDGVGDSARRGVRAASRPRGGAFGPPRTAPALAARPATYAAGRAVVLERRPGADGRERLSARFGSTTGSFGRGHTLARASLAGVPALAASGGGHVVAAWIERRGERRVVLVATRAPGGRFSRGQVLRGTGRADAVAAAVNERGALVVAWTRRGRVEARVRPPRGRFGAVDDLGGAATVSENRVVAAMARNGRAYVAWSARQLSEGGDSGPFVVRAALRPAGGERFRATQLLERAVGAQPQEARLALDVLPDGSATLAWTAAQTIPGSARPRFAARAATASRPGAFGPPRTISAPDHDAAVSDVATGGRYETLVVWTRLDAVQEIGVQVFGAVRREGAPGFLAPEAVSPPDERARVPAAAYDPSTGLPSIVWSARNGPDGPGVPIAQVRTYLRAATRTG